MKMEELGVAFPSNISVNELRDMSSTNIGNARKNVDHARQEFISLMASSDLAYPRKDQLLIDWQKDVCLFNSGARLEAVNLEVNKTGSGQKSLTLEAAWIIRHIMVTLSIPVTQFLNHWVRFYYLMI